MNCIQCGTKTTRIYKEKLGQYTLCDSCYDQGFRLIRGLGFWILAKSRIYLRRLGEPEANAQLCASRRN